MNSDVPPKELLENLDFFQNLEVLEQEMDWELVEAESEDSEAPESSAVEKPKETP